MVDIKFKKNHEIKFKFDKNFLKKKEIEKLEKMIQNSLLKLEKVETPYPKMFLVMVFTKYLYIEDTKYGMFAYFDEDEHDSIEQVNDFIKYVKNEVKEYCKKQGKDKSWKEIPNSLVASYYSQ